MKRYLTLCALLTLPALVATVHGRAQTQDTNKAPTALAAKANAQDAAPIQIALVLDNSGSMSGLLNQARSELWSIVNALSEAKQNDQTLKVQVALYAHGNAPAEQLVGFTDDLDAVSEALFNLGIKGGDEYAGQAIGFATEGLNWSDDTYALKLMFIAGNEPFTQGPVDYKAAIEKARAKGIFVNTIHCGGEADADWKNGALIGLGASASINHNKVVNIETPFDKEITKLGVLLNTTYIPYGTLGQARAQRQAVQDQNASRMNLSSSTSRALSKSSHNYYNGTWDLVDASSKKEFIKSVDRKTLPKHLQNKSDAELEQEVALMKAKRKSIQQKIAQLKVKRDAHLKSAQKAGGASTLSGAMIPAIRKIAASIGISGI